MLGLIGNVMRGGQEAADVVGGLLIGVERDELQAAVRPLPSSMSVRSRRLRITSAWELCRYSVTTAATRRMPCWGGEKLELTE